MLSIDATGGFEVQLAGSWVVITPIGGLEVSDLLPRFVSPFNWKMRVALFPKTNVSDRIWKVDQKQAVHFELF